MGKIAPYESETLRVPVTVAEVSRKMNVNRLDKEYDLMD